MALLQIARDVLLRVLRNKLVILAALMGASYLFRAHTASALPASPGKVPNGSVFSCTTCHLPDPAPKSANTQMKLDFLSNIPTKTWTVDLANKDSDGDGFSNGEELQDPNGVWVIGQPDPCCFYYVSNPSDPNSIPSPPQIFDITTSPSPAQGQISFDVAFDAALPIASIYYTLYDPNNAVVYQSVDTAWPWSSGVWNSAGAPKGDYTINVQVNENTRNPFAARGVATSRTFALNTITLSGNAYSVGESAGSVAIAVQLAAASGQTISMDYATGNGSATAGSDYTAKNGTITFNPGQTSKTINVPIANDSMGESSETFSFTLGNPHGAPLASPSSATITIVDDDQPNVQFKTANYELLENGGPAVVTVLLSNPASQQVTVGYTTSDDTASAGADYTTASGTLTFNPGQTSQSFTISIADDSLAEQDETLNIALSNPTNAALGATAKATLTISDNDVARPTVSISASDSDAAEAGQDTGTFTITRSGSTASALVVHYSTSGSASAGADYTALSGSVTIPAGQASATVIVTPTDDALVEGAETVLVTLSADVAYSIGTPANATVAIADNEQQTAPQHIAYLPIMVR
jgi:hypothetical protein